MQPARDRLRIRVHGAISADAGKSANEIVNLEDTEIGELYEPSARGRSDEHYAAQGTVDLRAGVASPPSRYNAAIVIEGWRSSTSATALRGGGGADGKRAESCIILAAALDDEVLLEGPTSSGEERRNLDRSEGYYLGACGCSRFQARGGNRTAHDRV